MKPTLGRTDKPYTSQLGALVVFGQCLLDNHCLPLILSSPIVGHVLPTLHSIIKVKANITCTIVVCSRCYVELSSLKPICATNVVLPQTILCDTSAVAFFL